MKIQVDQESVRRVQAMAQRKLRSAGVRALNKTGTQLRSEVAKELAAEEQLNPTFIRKRISLFKASAQRLAVYMNVRGEVLGVPLIAFRPRKKKVKSNRGVRTGVTVVIDGQRQLVPGGFIATMKSGRKGIYQRITQASLPIKEMFGRKISELLRSTKMLRFIEDKSQSILTSRLKEEMEKER